MVFHWSLSDRKFPQVSKTFLGILADLNNAVVWTVSTRLVISKSSSPCTNPLVTVPRASIIIGINITVFNSLARSRNSFHVLSVLLWGQPSPQFCKFHFFFFVNYYKVWSPGRDQVTLLYLKIPEEFVCLILQERCGVVYICSYGQASISCTITWRSPCPPNLILFLCNLAAFAYYVIDRFVSMAI